MCVADVDSAGGWDDTDDSIDDRDGNSDLLSGHHTPRSTPRII